MITFLKRLVGTDPRHVAAEAELDAKLAKLEEFQQDLDKLCTKLEKVRITTEDKGKEVAKVHEEFKRSMSTPFMQAVRVPKESDDEPVRPSPFRTKLPSGV